MARVSATKGKARAKSPANLPKADSVAPSAPPRKDLRRWVIYPALDLLFAVTQVFLIWKVVPNRLPSASFHLWTLPVFTFLLGVGTVLGGKRGWQLAVIAGSAALLSA